MAETTLPKGGDLLFPLGQVVATPSALAALELAGTLPKALLDRHARGDWGEMIADDWDRNDRALVSGERLLSAYALPNGVRVWIITEVDRSATTLLLPQDY